MSDTSPPSGWTFDAICTRFERAWRDGQRPDIADYLTEASEAERTALLRELVHLDIHHRGQRGESATWADYRSRFPELSPDPSATTAPGETTASRPLGLPVIPGYEVVAEIARGGMGVVYRARQVRADRVVALKMILPGQLVTDEAVQRFREEARNVARLEHENIVPIYEVGEVNAQPFFSMKFIEGGGLDRHLPEYLPDPRAAARLLALVARAVHHAHQHGIIHRDLKPANVLLDTDGQPHVTDFGLAKRIEASIDQSRSNAIIGTPCYMAPEQAAGRQKLISTVTDVYGLGAILYELLTGRPPFKADTPLDTLVQVLHDEPLQPRSLNPACPRDLEVICLKCLTKEPGGRYASALALAEDLERWLAGAAITARPVGAVERVVRWVRRHPTAAGLIVVSFLASLAGVGVLVANSYNAVLAEKNGQLATALSEEEIAKKEAERQRELARESETKANRYLYAARMTQASQASQAKNSGRVLQLLRSVIPERPDQEDLRGWEWHQLWRAHQGEQSRLRGHTGPITGVAFSPDNKLLASASEDGTVRLWSTISGREQFCLKGHEGRVKSVAFSPDGKLLASAGDDKVVRLWDAHAGEMVRRLEGHTARVTAVTFCSKTGRIVSGSHDKSVRLWDPEGKEVRQYTGHGASVYSIAVNASGEAIASISLGGVTKNSKNKGEVRVWETESGRLVNSQQSEGVAVAWSSAGDLLATSWERTEGEGAAQRRIPVIDITKGGVGAPLVRMEGHGATILQLAFTPDGKKLVSASQDQTLRTWDVAGGKQIADFKEEGAVSALAVSPDGIRFASGGEDGVVRIWDAPKPEARVLGTGNNSGVAFSPDGLRVASGDGIYDVASGTRVPWGGTLGRETRITWSPDGRFLASSVRISEAARDGKSMPLLDPKGKPARVESNMLEIAFHPDGKHVAGAYSLSAGPPTRNAIWICEAITGRFIRTMPLATPVYGVDISPDGRLIATGGAQNGGLRTRDDEWLKVWEFDTGKEVRGLDGFIDYVNRVKFSPDGRYLAAAIGNHSGEKVPGEVRIWKVGTWELLWRLRGHQDIVYSVGFSPDCRRLVSASGKQGAEVKIWDLTTGQEVWSLPTGECRDAAFSPDGRRLALVGRGGIRLYDGTPLAETPAYAPLPDEPRQENQP